MADLMTDLLYWNSVALHSSSSEGVFGSLPPDEIQAWETSVTGGMAAWVSTIGRPSCGNKA